MTKKQETVVIAQSAQNSAALRTGRRAVTAIIFPTMTSTAATMQRSEDGTNFNTIGDLDGSKTITNPSARAVAIDPYLTQGAAYFRVVAGSAEAEARTITIETEDYDS